MNRFYVIGMDDNPQPCFTPEVMERITSGKIFSGGKRHREIVASLLPKDSQWIEITVPLDKVFEQYAPLDEIVVFASGDPLFFGFANTIRNRLPLADIQVYPVFNSLQMLAHRLVIPYQDMQIVSLTGRTWHEFDRALIERAAKIGVLTDNREHTPAKIARRMTDYALSHYMMYIGEHLGNPDKQRIRSMRPEQAADMEFESPNCLILMESGEAPLHLFGIPDKLFSYLDGREKMITKMPIRLLSLQMLGLQQRKHFWDIGFCTGSVSIEAKNLFPHLRITAFEIREEGRELMEENCHRLRTPGIEYFIGDFCQTNLSVLDAPDAVFIGGHGGKLKEIVRKVNEKLLPGGVIVFNSVSQDSLSLFHSAVEAVGMTVTQEMPVTIDNYNTIQICRAVRKN